MKATIQEMINLTVMSEKEIIGLFDGTVTNTDDIIRYLDKLETKTKMLKKILIIFSRHNKKRIELLCSDDKQPQPPLMSPKKLLNKEYHFLDSS